MERHDSASGEPIGSFFEMRSSVCVARARQCRCGAAAGCPHAERLREHDATRLSARLGRGGAGARVGAVRDMPLRNVRVELASAVGALGWREKERKRERVIKEREIFDIYA